MLWTVVGERDEPAGIYTVEQKIDGLNIIVKRNEILNISRFG